MIKKTTTAMVAGAVFALSGASAMADDHAITVGYFLEWPMPFQYAKETGMYDEALGKEINWVSFDTGTAMSAAMASGDVQMSVSQGVPPFVVATSAGQDLVRGGVAGGGLHSEAGGAVGLRVEIHEQGAALIGREGGTEADRGGRLADPTLLVCHCDDP